jgi:wyosine [tRNA(Phe)-imidazoG37] synthetase (radical SAM superfamily)
MTVERGPFFEPEELCGELEERLEQAEKRSETVDFSTFVPDGEPTLDIRLGEEIELCARLSSKYSTKIAVITNSSLLGDPDVRDALKKADWVSCKVDSVTEAVWRRVDRPHKKLSLESILEGLKSFAGEYSGTLVTETMLVSGVNDMEEETEKTAEFISGIAPDVAFIGVPTRPPAVSRVTPPEEHVINRTFQIFSSTGLNTEYLLGFPVGEFGSTGSLKEDLLNITSVHPMGEDDVEGFLKRNNAEWNIVDELLEEKRLTTAEYGGKRFFMRKMKTNA